VIIYDNVYVKNSLYVFGSA